MVLSCCAGGASKPATLRRLARGFSGQCRPAASVIVNRVKRWREFTSSHKDKPTEGRGAQGARGAVPGLRGQKLFFFCARRAARLPWGLPRARVPSW